MKSKTKEKLKAYLLYTNNGGPWVVFGYDCVQAADVIASKIGILREQISVSGTYDAEAEDIIDLTRLWPFFTANPPERMLTNKE